MTRIAAYLAASMPPDRRLRDDFFLPFAGLFVTNRVGFLVLSSAFACNGELSCHSPKQPWLQPIQRDTSRASRALFANSDSASCPLTSPDMSQCPSRGLALPGRDR
jgi:hypothetical protein